MSILHVFFACVVMLSTASAGVAPSAAAPKRIGVALYGSNGHQLKPAAVANHKHARLVAVADIRSSSLPEGVNTYKTLDELIRDPAVELIVLCSPRRADQVRDAIRCLEAGKHVYAEKPSALTEPELDKILAAARKSGKQFHEMAGTAFASNYASMRKLVREGAVGDVIQIFVQKSYRYGKSRPQDEAIDGGLFLQAGVHAARMVEHVGGVRIAKISGWETKFGKPESEQGEGRIASAAQIELANGGLASLVINYLNPGHPELPHGYETLRIFGTKGFIESIDGGARTRLVTATAITDPLPKVPSTDYFDFVVAHLATGAEMPLTLEEELHPLRMLLRAKARIGEAVRR